MEAETTTNNPVIDKLFEVGAHFGFGRNRRHPTVVPFIYGTKNNSDIIDLEKTAVLIEKMFAYVKGLASNNKKILIVGNKPEARLAVKNVAEKLDLPYVAERWIGGTVTNFQEIRKRIARLKELEEGKGKDGWAQYTKGERALFQKELDQLHRFFDGIIGLSSLPAAILVIDSREEETAVAEAKYAHIPVISLSNTDCDLHDIAYPVVANDAATGSIAFFLDQFAKAYSAGRVEAEKKAAEDRARVASETASK